MKVAEVARGLGVHKATASRLLATLAAHSLVDRDPLSGRYGLGTRLVSLAGSAVGHLPLVAHAHPELERLSRMTSETTNLAVLDRFDVVYIHQVAPRNTVVMASWIGRRTPAHASSSGKVLLAFGDGAHVERLLARRLVALAPRTITDPARFRAVLAEVRRAGWARSIGELEEGLVTIAAPVLVEGRPVAAVSLSGPSSRITARDHAGLTRMVVETATAIAHRLEGRVWSRPSAPR
jgi:DNA-binding IclR family transcriptional regulator